MSTELATDRPKWFVCGLFGTVDVAAVQAWKQADKQRTPQEWCAAAALSVLLACSATIAKGQSKDSMRASDIRACKIGSQYFECTNKITRPQYVTAFMLTGGPFPISISFADYRSAATPAQILEQAKNVIRANVGQHWPAPGSNGSCVFGFYDGANREEVFTSNTAIEWNVFSEPHNSWLNGSVCVPNPGGVQTGKVSIVRGARVCPSGFFEVGTNGFPSTVAAECVRPVDSCSSRDGVANPISISGRKMESIRDYANPGMLSVSRWYDSTMRLGQAGGTAAARGGWVWSFESRVFVANDAVLVVLSSGERLVFPRQAGAGPWLAINKPGTTLRQWGTDWLVVVGDQVEVFDSDGGLKSTWELSGRGISYTRSLDGTVSEITDQFGRVLRVSYQAFSDVVPPSGFQMPVNPFLLVKSIELPDSSQVEYDIDPDNFEILSASIGGQLIEGYQYTNAGQSYSGYGRIALASKKGGDGNIYSLFSYTGETGHAGSSYLQGNVGNYLLTGTLSPSAPAVTVRDPNFHTSVRTFEFSSGVARITSQSQPAGSGCAASASFQSYDANGNIASRDDFNGFGVCYTNDLDRNLETSRVEGLVGGASGSVCASVTPNGSTLPSGARKISTQWHPDWSKAIRVAEPGRVTTSVYNGQPDPHNGGAVAACAPATALLPDGKPIAVLCKRVEQATTDPSGAAGFAATVDNSVAARVQRWTYNQQGQMLTATDALNHTTTYAYYTDTAFTGADPNAVGHTKGDLATVTNAAGHVTSYTQYDKHGNWLQSVDPNGVVTNRTLDWRQRLETVQVGTELTRYEYWPTGLLKKVTQPDGSFVSHEYDTAHRLFALQDNLGNRIEYTLDNAGNRTYELVKAPGGVPHRALSRSIDALGRVQRVTGRE